MLFPSVKLPLRLFFLLSLALPIFAQNHSDSSLLITLARLNLTQLNLLPGSGSGGKAMLFSGGGAGEDGGGNDWGGGGSSSSAQWIIQWPNTPESERKNTAAEGEQRMDRSETQNSENRQEMEPWMMDSPSPTSGSGGDSPEWNGKAQLNYGEAFDLFAQMDRWMAALPEGVTVIHISDFDDTLVPDFVQIDYREFLSRFLFRSFVHRWREQGRYRLIVVSHNEKALNREIYTRYRLPIPDYVIAGCTLNRHLSVHQLRPGSATVQLMPPGNTASNIEVDANGFRVTEGLMTFLSFSDRLQTLLSQQGFVINEVQSGDNGNESTVSLKVEEALLDNDAEMQRLREVVFQAYGTLARIWVNNGKVFVALPASKVALITRYFEIMGMRNNPILVTGDSIHDINMMNPVSFFPDYKVKLGAIVRGSAAATAEFRGLICQGPYYVNGSLIWGVVQAFHEFLRRVIAEPGN